MAWDLIWYFFSQSALSWFLLSLIFIDCLWRLKNILHFREFKNYLAKKQKIYIQKCQSPAKMIQLTWWPCSALWQPLSCMLAACLWTVMLRCQATCFYSEYLFLVPVNEGKTSHNFVRWSQNKYIFTFFVFTLLFKFRINLKPYIILTPANYTSVYELMQARCKHGGLYIDMPNLCSELWQIYSRWFSFSWYSIEWLRVSQLVYQFVGIKILWSKPNEKNYKM